MEKRLVIFFSLTVLLLVLNFWIQAKFFAPVKPGPQLAAKPDKDKADKDKPGKADEDKAENDKAGQGVAQEGAQADDTQPADDKKDEPAEGDKPQGAADAAPEIKAAPEPDIAPQWVTIGSADPAEPYRMLVTLTNKGAAIERVELNSPRYRDLDNRAGYLGFLATTDAPNRGGSVVNVVGPGTPAAAAGLKPGDVIEAFNGLHIDSAAELEKAINATQPGQNVELTLRDGPKVERHTRAAAAGAVRPRGR